MSHDPLDQNHGSDKVALVLAQSADAEALAAVLENLPAVMVRQIGSSGPTETQLDTQRAHPALLILDGRMLSRHHAWIQTQRATEAHHKMFVLLLLSSGRTRTWPIQQYRDCYDDILFGPLDRMETLTRVRQLLSHRRSEVAKHRLWEQTRCNAEELRAERGRREQLISTLGHDLRSPLTAARLCAQRLQQDLQPESRQQKSTRILRSLDRIDTMISDLLDASRVEKERCDAEVKKRCNLRQLTESALTELSSIHGDRFVVQMATDLEGLVQESSIVRVLENLCGNAVKYGYKDTPIVVQGFVEREQICLQVANQGDPVSVASMAALFDAFAQAPQTSAGGWGLGLSMVRATAQAHQGNTRAYRNDQGQNVFGLQFPTHEAPSSRAE